MLNRNATLVLAVVTLLAVGALAEPALYWGSHTAFTGLAAAQPDLVGPDGAEVPSSSNWLIQLLDLDSGNVLFAAPAGSIMALGQGVSYGAFYTTLADVGSRRGYSVGTRVLNSDSEATASRWAMFSKTTTLAWNTVPFAPATFTYDVGQVAQGDWREFSATPYTVTFLPGAHGSLAGGTPTVMMTVNRGDPAPAAPSVTPAANWLFTGWLPLLPGRITANAETTAQYAAADPVPPAGDFLAGVDANAVTSDRSLWNLSGPYTTTVAGNRLTLTLVHDSGGRLTGTATYLPATATVVTMPIRGSVKGTGGIVVVKLAMKGTDSAHLLSVSLTLNLTLDAANLRLTGPAAGSLSSGATSTAVAEPVALNLPPRVDGTWTLTFHLVQTGNRVTGAALLTLSNGVHHDFVVRGNSRAPNPVLELLAAPADPTSRAIKIRTTLAPLADGVAILKRFSCKGYRQSLLW